MTRLRLFLARLLLPKRYYIVSDVRVTVNERGEVEWNDSDNPA